MPPKHTPDTASSLSPEPTAQTALTKPGRAWVFARRPNRASSPVGEPSAGRPVVGILERNRVTVYGVVRFAVLLLVVAVLAIGGYHFASHRGGTPTSAQVGRSSSKSGNATTRQATGTTKPAQSTSQPLTSKSASSASKSSSSTSTARSSSGTKAGGTSISSQSSSSNPPPPPPTYSCITSDFDGECGPYASQSQIVGSNNEPWVDQNVWGAGGTNYTQTLYANSPGDWYVIGNVSNNTTGAVLTYPNTGFDMPDGSNPGDHDGHVDSYNSITSSWNVTMPTDSNTTTGWAAYDLWFNNWNDEVMIQTDLLVPSNGDYDCTAAATATFNGMAWHLCVFGSERVWKPGTDDNHLINQASGTVNVLAMLEWMEQNGYLPTNSIWTGGSFGFEICNTSGTNAKFEVNSFSWDAS